MEQLFEKIGAIAAINKEIFQRIRGDPSMLSFQARLQDSTHLVVDHTASQGAFLEWWRWGGELVAVSDTFKDKVDYSRCHTFAQLELLNGILAEQYRAFEGDFALAQLRQYLTNYELIQTAMGQVDAQFQANAAKYKGLDRTELVNDATHEANLALAKLAHLGVHLADVQGRPLFNLAVKAHLKIQGISATWPSCAGEPTATTTEPAWSPTTARASSSRSRTCLAVANCLSTPGYLRRIGRPAACSSPTMTWARSRCSLSGSARLSV